MTKRLMRLSILTGALLIAAMFIGCGEEKSDVANEVPDIPMSEEGPGEDSLNNRLQELKETDMTVEVIVNGESLYIWSQKDGNWRRQNPEHENFYVIYNASQKKTWLVSDKVATEISSEQYLSMNPASYMEIYAALPGANRSGDSWEINMPGGGKVSIEFKGPESMMTKMTTTDAGTGKTEVIEFKYSDVGSVPDSLFELPADVEVQQLPAGDDMGVTVPEF